MLQVYYSRTKLHEALDTLDRQNRTLQNEISLEKERERRRMLFFSGVSHELKTPIAIVIGQLEGMQANIGVYRDREKYLARSAEILQSLSTFIKEVLSVSHLDMNEGLNTVQVSLCEMINDIVSDYSKFADEYFIKLTNTPDKNVLVYADEKLLKKALANIISNAVTHTPEHGNVCVQLKKQGNTAELTVINSPSHIDESDLPHIFEAFYRADNSSKHSSGMGLYITRMIFETCHIKYSVSNTSDGVKFTVLFDRASE